MCWWIPVIQARPEISGRTASVSPTFVVPRMRPVKVEPISDSYQDFGAGQFIWRLGDASVDGYVAASDPRRDGARCRDRHAGSRSRARVPRASGRAAAAGGAYCGALVRP